MKSFWATLVVIVTLSALNTSTAYAGIVRGYSAGYSETLKIHYGIFSPDTTDVVGDVLYFHGYGDRFENHTRLFEKMNAAGLRVIAFDLPSHGGTYGGEWDDLDWFSFTDLAEVAGTIERETIEDSSRPLILSGWSTGGLLALRMAQSEHLSTLSRYPHGLLLFAPAVSVPACVGNTFCQITNETLTHESSLYRRRISPPSPLLRVNFAAKLLFNASRSWNAVPSDIPLLIWAADNSEDRYVNTLQLKAWVTEQRALGRRSITAFQCVGARHELDNETDRFGGDLYGQCPPNFLAAQLSKS